VFIRFAAKQVQLIGVKLSSDGSTTSWLGLLREGHPEAAQRIWDRYFIRLAALVRKKLQGHNLGIADEEDVALSALRTLCGNVQEGRYPQLTDGDGLWRLLVVIAARKALQLVRSETRLKRDRRRHGDPLVRLVDLPLIDDLVGNEPTPEFAAQVTEEYQRLMSLLDDDQRSIAVAKLQGLTNLEIAARSNRSLRTVERKLQLIRDIWEQGQLT
jgi:DNA-directed RNA polymerase specialized sigma24 family protein